MHIHTKGGVYKEEESYAKAKAKQDKKEERREEEETKQVEDK